MIRVLHAYKLSFVLPGIVVQQERFADGCIPRDFTAACPCIYTNFSKGHMTFRRRAVGSSPPHLSVLQLLDNPPSTQIVHALWCGTRWDGRSGSRYTLLAPKHMHTLL